MSALSPYSGSLATRPVRQIPSTKRQGTAASDAPARMMGGRSQPLSAPSAPMAVAPNRRDNILNARADGTFQAKRDLYNQQGLATGHSMDEAGNITLSAPSTAPANNGQPGQPPSTAQPSTPTATRPGPQMRRVGQINGMPAPLAIEQAKGVTNNVTRNVTPPVTASSPSQGPAADALAAFNTANPNVLTGADGVAQTDALAATRRTQVAEAVNATQGPAAAARRTGVSPTTTTPAGVPAPSPQFNGSQQDRYNLAMQAASQPVPAAPAPAPPQTTVNNGQQQSTTVTGSPPAPGYFAQKAAANPGGIISKGIDAAGMLKNSLSIGAQNIKTAAQAVAPVAVAPLRRLQQGVQSGVKATATGLQTQAERNPSGFLSRLMGTKTAVNPSKVALLR